MAVDWPGLVSGQDIVTTTPPPEPSGALLLGNGDVGVAVYGPPECLTLQVGKNDIWDYRDPMDEKRPVSHEEFLRAYADPAKPPMEKYLGPNGPDPRNEEVRWACHSPTPSAKTAGKLRLRNRALSGASYTARLRLWDAELTAELGTPRSTRVRTFVSYPRNLVVFEYTPERACELDVELARNHDSAGLIPNGPEFGASGRDVWVRYRFPPDPATYPDGFEYVTYGRVI